jgi:C4-dicarboxylate-specific signal transduction histidine kinase
LEGVSADELVEEVNAMAEDGDVPQEAAQRVQAFNAKLQVVREALKRRFTYYSRLATVGTIAQMLVHEIRNRTTAIDSYLRLSKTRCVAIVGKELERHFSLAEYAVTALERLADTFAPLASHGFRRGRRHAVLEESIARCLELVAGEVQKHKVTVSQPRNSSTNVSMDPGELDTIILNILLNALYWIPKSNRRPKLDLFIRRTRDGKRARVTVSDSGPGVAADDSQKIFLPGVTRKPGGIGMGLTVAAELISDHEGTISLAQPGKLGGATFVFDLPVKG